MKIYCVNPNWGRDETNSKGVPYTNTSIIGHAKGVPYSPKEIREIYTRAGLFSLLKKNNYLSEENQKLQREREQRLSEKEAKIAKHKKDLTMRRGIIIGLGAPIVGGIIFNNQKPNFINDFTAYTPTPITYETSKKIHSEVPQVVIADAPTVNFENYTPDSAIMSLINAGAFYYATAKIMRNQGFTEKQIKDNVTLLLDFNHFTIEDVLQSDLYKRLRNGPFREYLPKRDLEDLTKGEASIPNIQDAIFGASQKAGGAGQEIIYLGTGATVDNSAGFPIHNEYLEFNARGLFPSMLYFWLNRGPAYSTPEGHKPTSVYISSANTDMTSYFKYKMGVSDFLINTFNSNDPESVLKFVKLVVENGSENLGKLLGGPNLKTYSTDKKGYSLNLENTIAGKSPFIIGHGPRWPQLERPPSHNL